MGKNGERSLGWCEEGSCTWSGLQAHFQLRLVPDFQRVIVGLSLVALEARCSRAHSAGLAGGRWNEMTQPLFASAPGSLAGLLSPGVCCGIHPGLF